MGLSANRGGAIAQQPLVPGFVITGELSSSATCSTWVAMRIVDNHPFVLEVLSVTDLTQAQSLAAQQMAVLKGIETEHVVRQHGAIALADGTLALVIDQVTGGSLAHLLGARGQLTPGETITTVAPLFRALGDLHAAGVVHGDLAPGNVLFSADGRPLISDLGVASLLGRHTGPDTGTSGFLAPELVDGVAATPASDVYAMAALAWLCLAGAPPSPSATRPPLTTLRPDSPARLVQVLTSCLATNPAARPSAVVAATEVFDAAKAESVALASMSDPAAEITRRIRAGAASAPAAALPRTRRKYRDPLAIGVAALVAAVTFGAGATLFLRHQPAVVQPVTASATPKKSPGTVLPGTVLPGTLSIPSAAATHMGTTDVLSAPSSPRMAAAGLLQALVDARALAYVSRNPALLDLVYSPGGTRADVDKGNIATALENGGTYLGLSFVIKDVTFVDGTSDRARIRASVLTPAYETGQPDGRKISHAQDTVGPCVFSLSLTRYGWRILSLTTS